MTTRNNRAIVVWRRRFRHLGALMGRFVWRMMGVDGLIE